MHNKKPIEITIDDYVKLAGQKTEDIPRTIGFDQVKITYLDGSIRELNWLDWLSFREGIINNLLDQDKCKIEFYMKGVAV